MATINEYTKKDGSTAYQFNAYLGVDPVTGKKKRTTRRGFKTKKEARLALSQLELDVQKNGVQSVIRPRETFQSVYDLWVAQYKNTVKESTLNTTLNLFKEHVLPVFKDLRIDKIDVIFCQRTANKWCQTSPKRYYRYINYTSAVFKYAQTLKLIGENPMSIITMPVVQEEITEEVIPNFYNREELINFLSVMKEKIDPQTFVFFHLLAFTGLRKGEALALKWRDFNFEELTVSVNKTVSVGLKGKVLVQVPKTKSSIRTISIDGDTAAILQEWRTDQRAVLERLGKAKKNTINFDQLIFTGIDNQLLQPASPTRWLHSFYRKNRMDKELTVHGFRHTHCSLLFDAGVSAEKVQARMGHSDIKTTMNIYTHVTKRGKEETALKFADFMKNDIKGTQKGIQKGTSH